MGERQWTVEFHDEFEAEFEAMDEDVQDELLAAAKALQALGPAAGRPFRQAPGGNIRQEAKKGTDNGTSYR